MALSNKHRFFNNTNSNGHVTFTGGDTAGRLFPGLAAAEQLRREFPDLTISFCGSGTRFEREHVFSAGFNYHGFPFRPRTKSLFGVWDYWKNQYRNIHLASEFVAKENVSAVVGLGGSFSLPLFRAAVQAGVHVALMDQNTVPGRATRKLSRSAELICVSFAAARERLRTNASVQVTGNPVRTHITHRKDQNARPPRLLITGGGLGVEELNKWVPRALYKVSRSLEHWQIVHQVGVYDIAETANLYKKFAIRADVVPFVDDLPRMLRETDLVVCHAGGTTLAELAFCGVPAVLLPASDSSGDHQRINARCFTSAGAAVTIDAASLSGRLDDELGARLLPILNDVKLRQSMSKSMSQLAYPHAAQDVAKAIGKLISSELPAQAA
jgi:UDP-N-acetylglucosamine--N-acetylmuramyl-(pentapeptide) pyrophosphoryl-undecaprenol N-acetylglucosamine transferase